MRIVAVQVGIGDYICTISHPSSIKLGTRYEGNVLSLTYKEEKLTFSEDGSSYTIPNSWKKYVKVVCHYNGHHYNPDQDQDMAGMCSQIADR